MVRLTKHEQESIGLTLVIFAVLLVLLYFLRHHPSEMPPENPPPVELMLEGGGGGGGATINFGDSGGGAKYNSSQPTEEVVGSSDDKAEAVANTKPVPVRDPQMQNSQPAVNTPRKPTNAALDNLLSGSDQSGGNGNGISSGTYGTGGTGNGTGGGTGCGNGTGVGPGSGSGTGSGSGSGRGTGVGSYSLAGRKALNRPEPGGCNEFGKVTVQITVDSTGKVIKAETGRGTNASPCLISQAKAAAMKWKFDPGTSDKQVGTIVYNFQVTD